MIQIGILSDTHSYLNPSLFKFFENCDELWHAGDWGDLKTLQTLQAFKPVRGVYGNIDGSDIRIEMPEFCQFKAEELAVCMIHIGGYPGNYSPQFKAKLKTLQTDLMICGHSHILKVMKDPVNQFMHINPGAAGNHGFHKFATAIRLKIEGKRMFELEVWEQKKS